MDNLIRDWHIMGGLEVLTEGVEDLQVVRRHYGNKTVALVMKSDKREERVIVGYGIPKRGHGEEKDRVLRDSNHLIVAVEDHSPRRGTPDFCTTSYDDYHRGQEEFVRSVVMAAATIIDENVVRITGKHFERNDDDILKVLTGKENILYFGSGIAKDVVANIGEDKSLHNAYRDLQTAMKGDLLLAYVDGKNHVLFYDWHKGKPQEGIEIAGRKHIELGVEGGQPVFREGKGRVVLFSPRDYLVRGPLAFHAIRRIGATTNDQQFNYETEGRHLNYVTKIMAVESARTLCHNQ